MIRAGSVRMTAGLFAALLSASSFGQAPSLPPNQAAGHPSSGAPTQAQPQAKQVPPVVRVTTRLVQVNVIVQDKRSEEHTSELQSRLHLVCRLLLEKKKQRSHNAARTLCSRTRLSAASGTTYLTNG